jgi:hypothetical protein
MDELQALERWGELYHVSIYVDRGMWTCTIHEHASGSVGIGHDFFWDRRVIGTAKHDALAAIQSALIQAKAKWPKVAV